MKENTDGGQISYISYKNGVSIKRYRGIASKVTVPSHIDGQPVIAIEKKAFLSCKTIEEIVLPDTIYEIGDWAFAHTENLRKITLPCGEHSKGKELFLGCKYLKEIIYKNKTCENKLGHMLAIAVTTLHDYFLLDYNDIGKDTWIKRWDDDLIKLIMLDDLDGYQELWTCGEEDYEGKEYDIESYPVEKRKMKLRIVYFRLQHPYKMSDSTKIQLENYLKAYTKGMETCESWDIIIEEHKDELEYYKTFTQAGCVTEDNFDDLFADMKDTNAEIKAYMLRYKEEHFAIKDAFSSFELDW